MKKIIFIWLPFLSGLFLILVAAIDTQLFKSRIIDVQIMLGIETSIILFGIVSSIIVFFNTIYWILKKDWCSAFQSFISPILFMICFGIGGAMGAAYFNAT